MLINILIFLVVGAVVGFMAGLFGIGGGMVIIPALAYIFPKLGAPATEIMHLAAGTSLASIILTLAGATFTHLKYKTIVWEIFVKFAPGIFVGSILGAYTTSQLPTHAIKIIFGIFMLLMALQMIFLKVKEQHDTVPHSWIAHTLAGFVIGFLSALLGIGGGAIAVPIMMYFGLSMHKATATSLVCALLPCIVGTIVFILAGRHIPNLPAGSIGFVYLPGAIGIAICAFIFVPLGIKLAQNLSHLVLKRIFAVYLVLVGIDMLVF